MRSKLIIVATVVASLVLASQMAAADQVQEQLRLMEQRMAEMEDRLQATSEELSSAKATVEEQQGLLSDAGLVEEDEGIRSSVGNFLKETTFDGVVAAGYNYRFMGSGDNNPANVTLFRHPEANTFALEQFWFAMDNTPTQESPGGFHVDLIAGQSANAYLSDGNQSSVDIFTAYASYLAPIGNGVQLDVGTLATPLGAELLRTDGNYFVTQGLVWGLQPVTHTGVSLSTSLTDELGVIFGVVNDVYSPSYSSDSRDLAYYGQVSFGTDMFGLNVGAILGKNSASELASETGGICDSGDECKTSVFNVVATANPTDNFSVWADYTWARNFGDDIASKGDAHGISLAGRLGLTEATGFALRGEYVRSDQGYGTSFDGGSSEIGEIVTATATVDHLFADCVKLRVEGRADFNLSDNNLVFANGSSNSTSPPNEGLSSRDVQFVGLAELLFLF